MGLKICHGVYLGGIITSEKWGEKSQKVRVFNLSMLRMTNEGQDYGAAPV